MLRQIKAHPLRWLVSLATLAAVGWYGLPWIVPLPSALGEPPRPGQIYQASDGTPLRQLLNSNGQRMLAEVPFSDLPESLTRSLLAAEDRRFFSHGGVDLLAVARALVANLTARRITSGASTITQQLIKITEPPAPRSLKTKVREALLARRLEMTWSKEQILAAYANRVSFGNLYTGCAAAAEGYFHKPLSDLTDAESAFLAALPQAPGRLNPFRNIAPALTRQRLIIGRLHDLGWLQGEAYELAQTQPIRLQRFRGGFVAPHAIGLLNLEEGKPKGAASPTITTTLDSRLQRQVEAVITNRLEGLRDRHVEHAAAVIIENATGHVLAFAGSRDFFAPDGGQINGAWAPHSPGSALKPFTYALALQRGFTPASIIPDLPIEFQTPTGLYKPENYDHKLYGPMTLRYALGNSLNISAVRVLRQVGGAAPLQTLLQNLGLTTLTESPEHYGLGLTIGNAPVRLIELTNAYATLARQGVFKPWTLLPRPAPSESPAPLIQSKAAWWIADILSDNNARIITFGPHSPLQLPFRVAVKTGTSTNYRDNWTLGYTPEYTVGVWAGNFEGQPMDDVTGVTGAAPIWRDIFQALNERHRLTWFPKPADAQRRRFDPRTGHLIANSKLETRNSKSSIPLQSREETFFGQELPPLATAADYEAQTGRALLPPEYRAWSKSRDNWLGDLITIAAESPHGLRIASPTDGLRIRLDPDLPGDQRLLLRADPPDNVRWQSPTLSIHQEGPNTFASPLTPGSHEIIARQGNEEVRAHIVVEQK